MAEILDIYSKYALQDDSIVSFVLRQKLMLKERSDNLTEDFCAPWQEYL